MRASALVFAESGRSLLPILERLRAAEAEIEIVLLDEGREDALTRRALDQLDGVLRVPVAPGPRSRQRNLGVREASGEALFFVEPGYLPGPEWPRVALEGLADAETGYVTCPLTLDGEHRILAPSAGEPPERAASRNPCTVFRRSLWEELAGFDEQLTELDLDEFWLRAALAGYLGRVLEEPLVSHDPTASSNFRRSRERSRHLPAVRAIYEKHRSEFELGAADHLVRREQRLVELAERYHPIVERRRAAAVEHERLQTEIRGLTAELARHGETRVDWGELRRTSPVSPEWGLDRGKPVDRHYIEGYLAAHADDIRGAVLEVQENDYSVAYGGDEVTSSDVVDFDPSNPRATVVADLRRAPEIPDDSFDCFILTQTLHVIDDMHAVLREAYRILKPGGVLLTTFPCLSRVCLEYGEDGDFWRLTEAGVRVLLSGVFPLDSIDTRAYGNVLVATAFLYGLSCEEVGDEEFDVYDPYHPVLIGARAVKPGPQIRVESPPVGTILAYHRVADRGRDPFALCLSPEDFAAQMHHLREHHHPLPLAELVLRSREGDLPESAVAVTLDDGYLDSLQTASPILAELGIPATFFVSTEPLVRAQGFWWDLLVRVFELGEQLPEKLDLRWRGERRRWATASREEREQTFQELYHQLLLRSPPAQRDDLLRQLVRWSRLESERGAEDRALLAAEVVELASRDGHAIGAHGVHHLALSHQPYTSQLREIVESRNALQRLLGREIDSFAYPYGDFDDPSVDLVRAAGYRYAVTCDPGSLTGPRCDPFRLPRRTVPVGIAGRFAEWLDEPLPSVLGRTP